jgi:hypothetical protein
VRCPRNRVNSIFYFTKVPAGAIAEVRINRVALALNSDFYLLQPKNAPPARCTRNDVLPFLPKAEDHEGLNGPKPDSHAYVFRQELNNRVPPLTEGVVALNDVALLLEKADAAAQPGIIAAQQISDDAPVGIVQGISYCDFKFFKP